MSKEIQWKNTAEKAIDMLKSLEAIQDEFVDLADGLESARVVQRELEQGLEDFNGLDIDKVISLVEELRDADLPSDDPEQYYHE